MFIAFNYDLLEGISSGQMIKILKGGLMFDTSAILYINILYLFFSFLPVPAIRGEFVQKLLRWFYIITNFIGIVINLADTIYFRFTLRRTSMTFFSEFKGDVNFFQIFFQSIYLYWYIFVIGFIFLFALIYLSGICSKNENLYDRNLSNKVKYFNSKFGLRFYLSQMAALLIAAPLFIIGVRGGVTRTIRPITISNAGDFAEKAIHSSAVLNTPFSLIRTIGKADYKLQNFYENYDSMEDIYSPIHKNFLPDSLSQGGGIIETTGESARGKNVVILILESFGSANMQFLNSGLEKNFTPFLDSLSKEGMLFTNAFANGRKSIDAVPSILASIPSMINSYAVTPYSTNEIKGLPFILDSLGYYTAFFHGAPNNSMGIRAVSRMCGVLNYYGKDEYNDDSKFDGAWGIWDEYFLQYVADELPKLPQPFMANIFTLSSHHPFKVPKEWKEHLPDGDIPLQKTIAYSDMAVRKFFQKVKGQEWFKNTIFILLPDHSTLVSSDPVYSTSIGNTRIPIIYYAPGYIKPGRYDGVTQQIDIMPTLLGMMGYKKPFFAYGRDVNSEQKGEFAINYTTGQFQLVLGDTLLFRNDKMLTDVYILSEDPLLKNNLLESAVAEELRNSATLQKQDARFKAIIQQYINRLIENKLTVE
ncbi:MAG: sulfatase-like hydrolase/transferase [Bacteroidales bacterium]|nr:sulfatase-like hydrolase/transferase [Bacteroidales bacterium]